MVEKDLENDLNEELNLDEESSTEEVEATDEEMIYSEASVFLSEEEETEGFLPEVADEEQIEASEDSQQDEALADLEGSELEEFESANIEELEFVEEEQLESIVESILFASDRPVSLASIKLVFKGTNVTTQKIRRTLDQLAVEYAGGRRGITLEEVPGGYQLRTKVDNMEFLRRTLKTRQFKLSGPALEVLAIVAYKQPVIKAEIDEIRGVESGHLLRALMEKNLVNFEGKSELPGRPMQYGTTRKFLEIFGLRSIKELPTLSQIDELLPEGITEEEEKKPTLSMITDSLAEQFSGDYSTGEDELMKIQSQLEEISTSSDFFEQEKQRQKEKRDQEKAQNIREALALGEPVATRDINWLKRYDEALAAGTASTMDSTDETEASSKSDDSKLDQAIEKFDNDTDLDMASSDSMDETKEDSEDEVESDDELPFFGEAEDIDEEGENHL